MGGRTFDVKANWLTVIVVALLVMNLIGLIRFHEKSTQRAENIQDSRRANCKLGNVQRQILYHNISRDYQVLLRQAFAEVAEQPGSVSVDCRQIVQAP